MKESQNDHIDNTELYLLLDIARIYRNDISTKVMQNIRAIKSIDSSLNEWDDVCIQTQWGNYLSERQEELIDKLIDNQLEKLPVPVRNVLNYVGYIGNDDNLEMDDNECGLILVRKDLMDKAMSYTNIRIENDIQKRYK